jgi:serine/threonine-protein kinase HipA
MKIEDLIDLESVLVKKSTLVAGTLSRTEKGARFSYDSEFRTQAIEHKSYGLCFSLPPTRESYDIVGVNLHPYFAGLLPEGLRLTALRRALKTSEDDLFSMLLALGENTIGDVSVELNPTQINLSKPKIKHELELQELSRIDFAELFEKSIHTTDFRIRNLDTGIPGAMPKLSASMISFPVTLAKRKKQYILKLETRDSPALVQNEHFFMQMAKGCGLTVPRTAIVKDKRGAPGLLVERFDRIVQKGSRVFTRLHQEDACQFLGVYPNEKYRLSMRRVAEGIVGISSSSRIDVLRLVELYLFCYLIGNGDLHGKNISLIEEPQSGRIRLSPAYDLLTTLPYGDRTMALKLGAKDNNFSRRDLIEFGAVFELPERAVVSSIERLVTAATKWQSRFAEAGLDEKKTRDLEKTFAERVKGLIN